MEDLKEAIKMVKELVDEFCQGITVRSNSDNWHVFCKYGDLLHKKSEVTGNIDNLHESCSQYKMALQLAPYHSNYCLFIMHNYAGSLFKLYENTENIEYLNRSIDLYCEANHLWEGSNINIPYQCGIALVNRVEWTHKQNNRKLDENANQDLKDSLKYLCHTENIAHPDHPFQSSIQEVLAHAHLLKGGSENQ